jgi:adenylosuccinate lyase
LAHRLEKAGQAEVAHWVHVGITSFDTVDTAQRLRLKKFFKADFMPAYSGLKAQLKKWAEKERNTPQVGRTHGQWAVPSLFSLPFAEALHRLEKIEVRIQRDLGELTGQSSGAVGGYQGIAVLVADPVALEEKFLTILDLKPHYGSTQILPPEDVFFLANDVVAAGSVVSKVAEDLRHLARSEIAEIAEGLAPGQVGSSTMPQKRNPWNLEHVCSLFKILMSRLNLLENDLISEHQRDLTNSASGRFHIELFMVAYLMLKRLTKVLERLEAFPKNMEKHLESAGTSVFAESLYIWLTKKGVKDAHSLVREAARRGEKSKKDLIEEIRSTEKLAANLNIEELRTHVMKGPKSKLEKILAGGK